MTPPPIEGEARAALRAALAGLGFDEVRFARTGGEGGGRLRDWLAGGHQADMAWIDRTVEKRLDPELVLPGTRSMIALGVNYWSAHRPREDAPVWARYVLHEDYHDTIKPALAAAGRLLEERCGAAPGDYRYYVDTGPVLERGWAARSGTGFLGKNAMLISRRHGNWLFLAAILTRLDIAADEPLRRAPLPPGTGEPVGLLCGK
jgi:epoxyqueuosine reductase